MVGAIVIDPVLVLILAVLAGLALLVALGEIAGWRKALSPNAVRATQGRALADFLPYRRLVRADVIKNGSGSYPATWRIAATDANALAEGDILGAAYQLAATPDRSGPTRSCSCTRGAGHIVNTTGAAGSIIPFCNCSTSCALSSFFIGNGSIRPSARWS